jgi:transcriptional regulator with XRE-family HTH domain
MKQPLVVRDFISFVGQACPSVKIDVDHADKPDGNWWFDARVNGELLTVFWSPKAGFGFSTQNEIGFGEKPNEIYVSAEMAAARFVQLMRRVGSTRTLSLGIAELRELCGLSQTELAKRVGVEQAAISRVEGRQNLELNTLRSLVEAMGMRLSVQVLAPGVSANIEPGATKATRRSVRSSVKMRKPKPSVWDGPMSKSIASPSKGTPSMVRALAVARVTGRTPKKSPSVAPRKTRYPVGGKPAG